jgi:hypothetical protein
VTSTPDPDALYAKWLDTLKRVRGDVLGLHHDRQVWREVRQALAAASEQSDTFLRHYARLYVSAQVSALRRLSDNRPGDASLVRLLGDIARYPEAMTSERWVAIAARSGSDERYIADAKRGFVGFAEPGTEHVDARRIRADVGRFKQIVGNAREYSHKFVAHRIDSDEKVPLTFGELDAAIDLAGLLLRRYTMLLTAALLASLEPAIDGDWLGPLRRPLVQVDHWPPRPQVMPAVAGFY